MVGSQFIKRPRTDIGREIMVEYTKGTSTGLSSEPEYVSWPAHLFYWPRHLQAKKTENIWPQWETG